MEDGDADGGMTQQELDFVVLCCLLVIHSAHDVTNNKNKQRAKLVKGKSSSTSLTAFTTASAEHGVLAVKVGIVPQVKSQGLGFKKNALQKELVQALVVLLG
jgi:hypothetical protein